MNAIWSTYGGLGSTIKKISEADDDFLLYLTELDMGGQHFVCLAVSLAIEKKYCTNNLAALGKKIRLKRRNNLIEKINGSCPGGLSKALGKLGNRILARDRYMELVCLLENPFSAKSVRHAKKISPSMIKALATLDLPFQMPNALSEFKNPDVIEAFGLAVSAIKKILPDVTDRILEKSIQQSSKSDVSDLQDWFESWVSRANLPPPPWEGNDLLLPLDTAVKMNAAGRKFHNCLKSQVVTVFNQNSYFYEWCGTQPAIIELRRDGSSLWGIEEILGVKNQEISGSSEMQILNEFSKAGIEKRLNFEEISCRLFGD